MKQPRSSFSCRVLACCNPVVLVLASALLPGVTLAQGEILFLTRANGVDAPVTNFMTGERIIGTEWSAQLYYGLPGVDESAMVTFADPPVHFGSFFYPRAYGGYIMVSTGGGSRRVDSTIVPPGMNTAFQIRVWSTVLGNNWEDAYANWLLGPPGRGAVGKSTIIATRTSETGFDAPFPLLGMQGFYVGVPVPEPGFEWLAGLGLAVFFGRVWFARMWRH